MSTFWYYQHGWHIELYKIMGLEIVIDSGALYERFIKTSLNEADFKD